MRLMSFSATVPQMLDRSKTVTRRMGWVRLELGDLVLACEKTRGIAKEDRHELGVIEIIDLKREPLSAITELADGGYAEVYREGFPTTPPEDFIELFCKLNDCTPDTEVTVIQFRHRPELTHCCGAPRAFHLHAVGHVAPACSKCGQEVD